MLLRALIVALTAAATTMVSGDEQCFFRDCNSVVYPQTTYVDGFTGRPTSFDCSDAVARCRTNSSQCRYSLVWTRYAGCADGRVPNAGRFEQSSEGRMSIAGVRRQDAGVWGCEVRGYVGQRVATTITFRVFLLHVDQKGLTCADQTCSKRSVCYQILRTGSQIDLAIAPPQRGCTPFQRLPKDVFNGLSSQPTKSCKSERASPQYCSWTGRYSSASNYVCCWCFSNACDGRSSIRQDTIELAFRGSDDSCAELARLRPTRPTSLVAPAAFQTTSRAPLTNSNCVILLVSAILSSLLSISRVLFSRHSHGM
uniref:Ig-like domain-containing protein n=1 Tax=Plectus sambesii TaxID=2011161 RepID=A0A914XPA7_9BILA